MKSATATILLMLLLNLKNFGFDETNKFFGYINPKDDESLLSLQPIRFNFVLSGKEKTKYLSITNAGSYSIKYQRISLAKNLGSVFSFLSSPIPPALIQPNEKININLSFQPQTIDLFYDTLMIEFSEPFYFLYEVPLEGYSYLFDTLWINDTSAIIGTNELTIPIFLKGVPELEESLNCDLSFDLTIDNSVFNLDNENLLPIQSKVSNNTLSTYRLLFKNVIIDENEKILTNLIGKVLLGNNFQTTLQLLNITTNLHGVYVVGKSGKLETLPTCLSDYSMIKLNSGPLLLDVVPNPAISNIKIHFKKINEEFHPIAKITVFNIYGFLVYEFKKEINNEVELDISFLPSGLYRLSIQIEGQQYSKLICVVK
ncbi:MAG: T9SS type A sorting domain-containing protein [Candidatus Kapaibacteriales bacterium]